VNEELISYPATFPVKEGHSLLVYIALVLVCLLSVLIFSFYQEQSKRLLRASVNSKAKSLLSRIDSETVNKAGGYMNVLFIINVLIFSYGMLYKYKYELFQEFGKLEVFILLAGVLFLLFAKYLVHWLLGFLFKTQDLSKVYLEELYLKYKLFGVLLFPLILLLLFSESFAGVAVFIGISTYAILWVSMITYALKQGLMSKSLPKYYPFLYICTLEIIPLAIAGKIFQAPMARLIGF